jgi:hypothetical protein
MRISAAPPLPGDEGRARGGQIIHGGVGRRTAPVRFPIPLFVLSCYVSGGGGRLLAKPTSLSFAPPGQSACGAECSLRYFRSHAASAQPSHARPLHQPGRGPRTPRTKSAVIFRREAARSSGPGQPSNDVLLLFSALRLIACSRRRQNPPVQPCDGKEKHYATQPR